MGSFVAALLAGLSEAVLAVFAKLLSEKMLEKILTRLVIAIAKYAAEKTDSPFLDQVAAIVDKELTESNQ